MEKQLIEKRNFIIDEMEGLVKVIETEKRAFNGEENKKMADLQKEIQDIDKTLKTIEETRKFDKKEIKKEEKLDKEVEKRALEEKSFLDFCKGETRALDVSTNGGIVPTTIANKIIEKVKELSPIYGLTTIFNVKGTLVFPIYDEESSSVSAAYMADLEELTEGTGKFVTVELKNFIVGSLAKISNSLMNQADIDLLSYIINEVAKAIANFLEKELIVGTTNKMTGVLSSTNITTTASSTEITFDDLMELEDSIPDVYKANACFIMNKKTRSVLRKIKNTTTGDYVLQRDLTAPFGYVIMGYPVYITNSMPEIAEENKVVVFGDMSGLYTKLTKDVQIKVLNEKYATQNATGVVGYVELDSKIVEPQKLAVLQVKASA